jgi:XTP/dITP diphosphohydrolase
MKLLLATTNDHKAHEVRALLAGSGVELLTLRDHPEVPEPPETGDTFEANALQKARFVYNLLGVPVVADDSGLEVKALGGAPGVHSKRFNPEADPASPHAANNALLLQRLEGISDRRARFRCVLALVAYEVADTVSGSCEGHIAESPRGEGGFGYDPLFLPDELPDRTMAEASLAEKNAISHRGRAFQKLLGLLARHGLTDR